MTTDKNVNSEGAGSAAGGSRGRAARQRRSPEAARENILTAAEAILTGRGPQELKLTEVAARAGVATATVLHHFASVDAVQMALMERMVVRLAARVLEAAAASPAGMLAPETDAALFDAFEEEGVARLAAWMIMTGEAPRLDVVRRAVDSVVDLAMERLPCGPGRAVMEELALASITAALGAGLFGAALSELLGKPADAARAAMLAVLAARAAEVVK